MTSRRPIVLDTDVASLLIKGNAGEIAEHLEGQPLSVSVVTIGELVEWARVRNWGDSKWAEMMDWLYQVTVLPHTIDASYAFGELSGAAAKRGRPRPENDMWIAATCMAENLPLATRNVRDYVDFVEFHDLRMALD